MLTGDDGKADGEWGAALTCKTGPALPPLAHPEIFVSLDGLTLRLVDRSAGFEKIFPVGVGTRDTDPTSITYGESRSYYPIAAYAKQDFVIKPSTIQPCKVWWTDPETGERLPVFAGLPFLSWSGSYAIHGPIDNYRAPNGGSLRRGYVSHGCIRMAAADVLEVYARIKGVASVPVHVQREAERTAAGGRVDAAPWIGSECRADADCAYPGGVCKPNRYSGRGFCSARCMPARSLCSSNGSRLSSLLITSGITSSAVSKVVKRSPQERHSRRRRICRPSAASRESLTLVSTWPQKGQYMTARPVQAVRRAPRAQGP